MVAAALARGESRPSEYEVKAAYLIDFGRFLRTESGAPAHSGQDFNLCVLGEDPMGGSLDALAKGEKIGQRPVQVLRLHEVREAQSCDIVYVSASQGDHVGTDLEALRGAGTLTVSDVPDFLRQGGMIQFVLQGDHVRFKVNLTAARQAHIVLSSELLRVASSVVGAPSRGVLP